MTQRNLKSLIAEREAKKSGGTGDNFIVSELLKKVDLSKNDLIKMVAKLIPVPENGKTPTKEELLKLIMPLIPTPENGKTPTRRELLELIFPLIPKVENGKTPTKQELISLILPLIPKVKDGKPGRPGRDAVLPSLYKLAINTINVIESLEGDERLDAKAIKGLEKLIDKLINNQLVGYRPNFGGPGEIFHDLSLGGNGTASAPLYVIGGGGTTIEIPSGDIDGINTVFTVTAIPKYVVLNGVTYFENDGYTRSDLTITMLVVPVVGSTLRSAY